MGNRRSGWYGGEGRPNARGVVEECELRVSVHVMRRAYLLLGKSLTGVDRVPIPRRERAEPDWVSVECQPHPLYQGGRLWFRCPKCDRRRGWLYATCRHGPLACRTCHNLTYGSHRYCDSRKFLKGLAAIAEVFQRYVDAHGADDLGS